MKKSFKKRQDAPLSETSNSIVLVQEEREFIFSKALRARQVRDFQVDSQMWLAEVCQRAGRYDDMLDVMENVIANHEPGVPLFKEQQTLLFIAFERFVKERRRSLQYIENVDQARFPLVLENYVDKTKRIIDEKCQGVLKAIDAFILPFAVSFEDRASLYKTRADYSRYLAEVHEGDSKMKCMKASSFSYQKAYQIVTMKNISPTSALALSVVLNYSIFLSEFMHEYDKSQAIVRQALTYTTDPEALEAEDDESIYGMIELLRERLD